MQQQQNQINNSLDGNSGSHIPMSKEELENKATANKKISKKLVATAIVEVCILMMMSFAWYYYQSHRKVLSEEREVMAPYYLYLVDETGEDSFSLTVGDLHPGEVKQIILGVTNKKPTGTDGESNSSFNVSKDSVFDYELELAYTKNLPLEYKVYELTKTTETTETTETETTTESASTTESDTNTVKITVSEDNTITFAKSSQLSQKTGAETLSKKNNQEMYLDKVDSVVNLGQYDIYDKDADKKTLNLVTQVNNGTVTFDLDYYLIELEWKDGITFSDYLKETDLVYVIVKAMQLEPEETTEAVSTNDSSES